MRRAPGDSEAWRKVGRCFHQDVGLCHATTADAFRDAAATLGPDGRAEVATLLRRALSTMTPSEMTGVWNRAGADVTFDAKDIRALFCEAIEAMTSTTP